MTNPLDRPIWFALIGRQRAFSRGGELAVAYRPDVEPFAAARDYSEESLRALASLCPQDDVIALIQKEPSPPLPGLELVLTEAGVQMVSARALAVEQPVNAVKLRQSDAAEMLALARLTQPGPFRSATQELGQFWGIRCDGRLVAMAGERMKLDGMTEVSGVCTHPHYRGHGFAAELSSFVAAQIQGRGEMPFLHAFAHNAPAIQLYRRLGFELRSEVAVQVFAHQGFKMLE